MGKRTLARAPVAADPAPAPARHVGAGAKPPRGAAPMAAAAPRRRIAVAPASTSSDGGSDGATSGDDKSEPAGSGGSSPVDSWEPESGSDSTPPGSDSEFEDEEGDRGDGKAVDASAPPTPAPPADPLDAGDHDSDSSLDGRPRRNTAGAVPVEWYRPEPHVGYDVDGKPVARKPRNADLLDALLARADGGAALRTIYDEAEGEDVVLSRDEIRLVRNIREGRFPHVGIDPFEPEDDYCSRVREIHPLNAAPEPKRRFAPSKWEEKAVVKLVRAIRRGWLKPPAPPGSRIDPDDVPFGGPIPTESLWGADGAGPGGTAAPLAAAPAPKPPPPGHALSYRPPPEYLPTEEEKAKLKKEAADDDAAPFIPSSFDALRRVPTYADAVRERFERCLDLYLCPRARRRTPWVRDAASLLPDLPSPDDLRPFPRRLALRLADAVGDRLPLRALAVDPAGQWVAAGGDAGVVTVWCALTGRRAGAATVGGRVRALAWRPTPKGTPLLAVAAGSSVVLLPPPGVGTDDQKAASAAALASALDAASRAAPGAAPWKSLAAGDVEAAHKGAPRPALAVRVALPAPATSVAWHAAGDYFVTACRTAPGAQGVAVHRLSTGASQAPFRRLKGPPAVAAFHPTRPALLVGCGAGVRVYDLAKQSLERRLRGGSGAAVALAVHPRGDHVLVGGEGGAASWFDLDLASEPFRVLRYHNAAVRAAAFHPRYPLFATAGDDGAVHVLHGTAYADLASPPLIVPLKVLPAHGVTRSEGALALAWHPGQPWLWSAGGDGCACLWVES